MKKITLFIIILMSCVWGNYAQVNGYNFSQNPGTFIPITGGTVLASPAGDDVIYPVTLPSAFVFNGVTYTAMNVSSNGFVTFGATAPSTTNYSPISGTAGYAGAIAAVGRDLNSLGASSEIRWEQIGDEIIVQWLDVRRYNIASEQLNFQIRLNVVSKSVQIVYGTCVAGSNSTYPQVGLRGATNSDYNNRTIAAAGGAWINSTAGTSNSSTMYFNSTNASTAPASGLTYTWTLPSTATLTYYNLQWPPNGNITVGDAHNVYAQAYEPGVTDAPGQGAGIQVWIGYSSTDTNPNSPTGWTWFPAVYGSDQNNGSNDEYIYNIANGRTPGTYYYASRFKYNGGPYTYGGIQANGAYGGTWGNDNNISGILVVNAPPAPVNDLCSGAITVSCGNTYTGSTLYATPESPDPGTCGTTAGTTGGAVWYKFIGANSSNGSAAVGSPGDTVTLDLSLSSFDTKIRVFSGACGALTCVGGDDDGGAGTTSLYSFPSIVGTEYYVLVHGYNANAGNYSLAMTCVAPPSCIPATFTLSNGSNNCPGNDFYINVNITAIGSAASLKITNDGGAPAITGATVAGSPYQVGPFPSGAVVGITVEDEADSSCFATSTVTTSVCPPPNNLLAGAIPLTVGDTVCEAQITGTNIGATDSGELPSPTCANYLGGDIWYKVQVPSTGELIIETSAADTNSITDTGMSVYSGTSGSLVELDCDDDNGPGLFSQVVLAGLNPGDILFVRVWEYENNLKGDFKICAWSPASLGVTDSAFEGFGFYPNPVKDILTLSSQKNIENVTIFNVLGQQVLKMDSHSTIQNINMMSFQSGTYIIKVMIDNQTKIMKVIKE